MRKRLAGIPLAVTISLSLVASFGLEGVIAQGASASQIVSTSGVSGLVLGVNAKGEAMVSYRSGGKLVHVLGWGAENAVPPPGHETAASTAFELAYDGGYTKYFRDNPAATAAVATLRSLQGQLNQATEAKNNAARYALGPKIKAAYGEISSLRSAAADYWKTFSCPTYSGVGLKGVLVACAASDGSTWVVESRVLGAGGTSASEAGPQSASGIELAHWVGSDLQAASTRGVVSSAISGITLGVNSKGEAMVSYQSNGKTTHVLATSAAVPVTASKQVSFQLAYDGGYTKYYRESSEAKSALASLRDLQRQMQTATAAHDNPERYALKPRIATAYAALATLRNQATDYWQTFTCPTYTGPPIVDLVAACTAPDGSYWAVQSWDRDLPDYGLTPTTAQAQQEVHLSHWTGALPQLTAHVDWSYAGRWNHLWGTYTYEGRGVYGFHSTAQGMPLDSFGRNIYLDTFDSAYGPGWHRENSFLTHGPAGSWCYSVNPHGTYPAGTGSQYRITILGPGVTPDVSVTVEAPSPYAKPAQLLEDTQIDAMHDPSCVPHEGSQPDTDLTSAKK